MIAYKEIETKYSANRVSLKAFTDLVSSSFTIDKHLLVSSYDDYFTDINGNFIRYRHGDNGGELTIKRKTTKDNNFERIEVNVPIKGNDLPTISAFVEQLNYKHNFGIFKTCQIFWVGRVVLVYYVVYDMEFKELRRFIEIEANEELSWNSAQDAWSEVVKYEEALAPLGISAKSRLKKSLFEMFKKPFPT